jgi:diadenylate cyclase
MNQWIHRIPVPDAGELLEIFVLAVIFYYVILFFRGTRGAAVLTGFALFLIASFFVTEFFNLDQLNWLLQRFSVYLALAILIIFQPEIRRAFAELGKQHRFGGAGDQSRIIDAIVQALMMLADRKIGALVAVEREIGTRSIQETGTHINSSVTTELLATLFFPNTPLHDGGVIIAGETIMAAGCLFPLSQRDAMAGHGMRHRAALGMSEETDALVLVVSEETGQVSVAYKGHLSLDFTEERLAKLLARVLARGSGTKSRLSRVKEQLDLTPEGVAKTVELSATEQGPSHAG